MHCKSYSHFFSKKFQHICVSLDVNFNESLTNDVVSFEQLGPGFLISPEKKHDVGTHNLCLFGALEKISQSYHYIFLNNSYKGLYNQFVWMLRVAVAFVI